MSQPPEHEFYTSSTDITEVAHQKGTPLQDVSDLPTVEQLDFPQPSAPPFVREQLNISQAAQQMAPDFAAPPARYHNQGPLSQPGSEQPGYSPAPESRGPARQYTPSPREDEAYEDQRTLFPPPSGPVSHPGFNDGLPASQAAPPVQPGPYAQNQGVRPPWEGAQPSQASADLSAWPTVIQPSIPAKPKRSGLMLVLALLGLLVLLLGSGAFVFFTQKGNSGGPGPQPSATAHHATPITTAQPTSRPTNSANGLNTPVQAGPDWLITLTSARTSSRSLIAPNAGHTYLELYLTLKNTSNKTHTVISILEFSLHDPRGQRYNETATDTNIHRLPDGNFGPRQSLNTQLAYEVPTTQHTFILTFAYGLSTGSNRSVSWRVEV